MNQPTRLLLLSMVLLSATVVAATLIMRSKQAPVTTQTPATPSAPVSGTTGLQLQAQMVRSDSNGEVTLNLLPIGETQDISTLGLEVIFKASSGSLFARSSNPAMGNAFKGNGWTIPFSDLVTNDDGTVTLKVSAIYASPSPFTFSESIEFAKVVLGGLEDGATLSYTINDPEVSKAYDKAGTMINFSKTSQTLTIAE
jgi:hypothetical protein